MSPKIKKLIAKIRSNKQETFRGGDIQVHHKEDRDKEMSNVQTFTSQPNSTSGKLSILIIQIEFIRY